MKRNASAVWQGSLKEGQGMISTQTGVLSDTKFSFGTRFGDTPGTNPEELIAAAHAGCFSMAFSAELGNAGITPESVSTKATLTMEKTDAGWTTTEIHLDSTVNAAGADNAAIEEAGGKAKAGCPISRLLNTTITLSLTINS